MAVELDQVEKVRQLLRNPTYHQSFHYQDFHYQLRLAANDGCLESVKLLLADGRCDPPAHGSVAIRNAVLGNHLEIVYILASIPGVITSAIGWHLTYAVQDTLNFENLKRMATMTGALSTSDEDLLIWAAAVGSLRLVRLLVDRCVDPKCWNESALTVAMQHNRTDVMAYLSGL